ncbi:MAG: thioredoxin family protein [Bacteroidales bacterium]|nr:thioredoxin family protein [Bacteroidales bacterium]MDZ4203964.1 thioredoxin family protein [Bacteroidales bacterium]
MSVPCFHNRKKAGYKRFFGLFFSILVMNTYVMAQQNPTLVGDPRTPYKILVGVCERADLYDSSLGFYHEWEYDRYYPDSVAILKISKLPKDYTITIVLGSWCGDSREQVPRFLKIIDLLGIDSKTLRIIGTDRQKLALTIDISHLNIIRVPTFIFFRTGNEVGRIIETPETTLEKEMLKIITSQPD